MNRSPEIEQTGRIPAGGWRWPVVALLSLQLVIFEAAVASPSRFPRALILRLLVGALGGLVYGLAIASLTVWKTHRRKLRWILLAAAAAISFRFYSPLAFRKIYPPLIQSEVIAGAESPTLVAFLRELAAAEEQYRLLNHAYSAQFSALQRWMPAFSHVNVEIRVRGDTGWAARASDGKTACAIWVRDSVLRTEHEDVEGSPTCGTKETRTRLHRINTVLAPPLIESPFHASDITGEWRQHRADAQRSGVIALDTKAPGYRWTTLIGGPVRSSAAIAGNQVFVGSHANGEIVALSLDSGRAGFRVRAPNWVHHEPVITDRLVIFGFGNNEPSDTDSRFLGSPPSGIVAYDRMTGREVWRRYTRGSVMSSPALLDSMITIVTGSHEVIAFRAGDGMQLWNTGLPDFSPMANPAISDSLFIIGVEPATLCGVGVHSGRKVYCHVLSTGSWGAGHASAAVAGDLVLQVYEEDLDGSGGTAENGILVMLRRIIGLPPRRHGARPPTARREQVMVAVRRSDGTESWRARLGQGTLSATGHTAGTPTVSGNIAFVPSPVSEKVVAVDTRTGKVIWSAPVNPARGSVLAIGGMVIAATRDTGLVVLDAATGAVRCRQRLPQVSDRAGLTVSGSTGVLTLTDGMIMARPVADWAGCRA